MSLLMSLLICRLPPTTEGERDSTLTCPFSLGGSVRDDEREGSGFAGLGRTHEDSFVTGL